MKQLNTNKPEKAIAKKKSAVKSFTVVAIGASAGGLDAVSALFKNLPINTGMAFIYVQHLSRDHKSFLTSILSKTTKMKVQEIEDMERMDPNNVYVIPSNKEIKVIDGHIQLLPRPKSKSSNLSIDLLFSSLAATHKENVIGIILSGYASDGMLGLKAIKDAGGLTFAQDGSAQASSMPKSAIASGVVDFILSPKEIARKLVSLSKNGFRGSTVKGKEKENAIEDNDPDLKIILEILHKGIGVDFSRYKMATIKRRLDNRMLQRGIKTIKEYAQLLLKKNDEAGILYKDLLINVTSFFRDEETFEHLKTSILPKLLKNKTPTDTLRIWVPACSSGEEAYSIAMLISELQDKKVRKIPVQIFATDLSEGTIYTAHIGKYSQNDMESVSQNRIKRFFTRIGENYQIAKEVREMCVFASHNILSDPPFFRIDFISCRNLLIYFDAVAQKRVLTTLHFALNNSGYLMLGKSETTGAVSSLFKQINNKFKIYSRKNNIGIRKIPELTSRFPRTAISKNNIKFPFPKSAALGSRHLNSSENKKTGSFKIAAIDSIELDSTVDTILLSRYMPACAIINKDMEILKFRGSTSLFLSHPSGNASLNILKMVRPEFALDLRNTINAAIKTKQSVYKPDIEIEMNAAFQKVSLEVCPLKLDLDNSLFLIVFTLKERVEYIENGHGGKNNSTLAERRVKKLTAELINVRAEMRSVIESQEIAYEELQAANEEIVSTSEEFQTLNEELETSKEETEATNEELITTNQDLKTQNELLAESYDYSQTIIATIHEPMIVLDSNLNVKSANKSFYKKFHVTKEETVGMPLFELGNKQWEIPKLHELLEDIISKNSHFENFEVTHIFPGMGEKVMLLNANRIVQKIHREKLILLAIEDITERTTRQRTEKEYLKKDIRVHQEDKRELEKAVRRRTRQLEQKNEELESANKDLTTFTYVSSHDLQEPLRKIQNFVVYILKKEVQNLSSEGKGYFERMQETAKRMQALIEDLLTYSRTKTTEPNFEKIDFNIILNEVKIDFEEIISEKKAVIKTVNLGEVRVIPFQFRQMLHNLIGNSLKFSKPRLAPQITIKCEIVQGSKLHIEKLSSKINYCHIIYNDNGRGFDPQYNERVFEVFQRLHSYEEYKGTGIGLAICKRVVENHKGVITATGRLNKGVRFDIYIPAI